MWNLLLLTNILSR